MYGSVYATRLHLLYTGEDTGVRVHRPTLQTRSRSLNEPVVDTTLSSETAFSLKRARANTIRETCPNHPQQTVPDSGAAECLSTTALKARVIGGPSGSGSGSCHTREDGPRSAKALGKLRAIAVSSESDSDDELLLTEPWAEGLECPGLSVPEKWKGAKADVLNLVAGKVWHDDGKSSYYWARRR